MSGATFDFKLFQSTPPVKAATHSNAGSRIVARISIHAAREGGDWTLSATLYKQRISIHAAREGGDAYTHRLSRSAWISIHAAREGGDAVCVRMVSLDKLISIHAAREGGD